MKWEDFRGGGGGGGGGEACKYTISIFAIRLAHRPIMNGGTFFIGFIIEYLAKLNAIILVIYSR